MWKHGQILESGARPRLEPRLCVLGVGLSALNSGSLVICKMETGYSWVLKHAKPSQVHNVLLPAEKGGH